MLFREVTLTNKLNAVDQFAKDTNVHKSLRIKLRAAVRYLNDTEGFSWKDKQDIFNELPVKLKFEVTSVMHKQAAERIIFFLDKDPVFITAVIPLLSPIHVKSHDYIYYSQDISEEIYFIIKGKVSMIYDQKKIIFCSYLDGKYFGDFEIMENIKRKFSAMSIFNCNLLVLNFDGIKVMREEFPKVWESMKISAKHRDNLCEIALEKIENIVKLKREGKNKGKNHEEVKDMLIDMVKNEFYSERSNKEIVEVNYSDEVVSRFEELDQEVAKINYSALLLAEKLDAIEKTSL